MFNYIAQFRNDEQGQDLIEYSLLIAFVSLASAALLLSSGGSISTMWSETNIVMSAAATIH